MKKLIVLISIFAMTALSAAVPVQTAQACFLGMGSDCTTGSSGSQITITSDDLGLGGAPKSLGSAQIEAVLDTVYLIAGIVAVVAMVLAGIRYTTANGDSNQIQAAKNTMFYAIIGLVVIIMAAAITQFVITGVSGGNPS